MIRSTVITIALGLGLCACGQTRPDSPISPNLDSGVTSSNGGGTRTLNNTNSTTVSPGGGGLNRSNNNTQGRSY